MGGPHVSASSNAEQRLGDWLAELEPAQSAALDALLDSPHARTILLGIAEFSPYLFDLIRADAARLIRVLACDPESHLSALIEKTSREVFAAAGETDVMHLLRRMKAEAALDDRAVRYRRGLAGDAGDGGADRSRGRPRCRRRLRFLLRQEVARGRMTAVNHDRPEEGSGLIVLAMGKMGAGELNYSSDIDLIVFFDPAATSLVADIEPAPFFVRVTQALARLLQQRSGDGYVFRVDLRLRPDPASTQVAMSIDAALHYYEREGRTWERAAMIKARPCAGDPRAGEAMVAELAPFVWRKHLDFAALADVHDMKRQMQTYRGQSEIAVEGHNVKVGRGGIREIEFFAQTQQLIAGGRHPELAGAADAAGVERAGEQQLDHLRGLRRTDGGLRIPAPGRAPAADGRRRADPCVAGRGRRLSSALQTSSAMTAVRPSQRICSAISTSCRDITASCSRAIRPARQNCPMSITAAARTIRGCSRIWPRSVSRSRSWWRRPCSNGWRATIACCATRATKSAFVEFIPGLIDGLAHAEDPDDAVTAFDRFLGALQRGGRLISLLSQNRDLVALVALILGAAPRLGDMLARQPQIMDGLIDPRFFGAMPDQKELSARLAATLKDAASYEDFLDRLRLFGQESLFLIGTRILSGTVSAQQASVAFADVAEGIVNTVHGLVTDQFAAQYGRIKGQETAILAMGRLGSREMTASSDLDLILLYDFDEENPDSDGERSLHGAQYFARFTQRLISAFTTRTNYGVLYDVDMRLRPSGRAGPVASRIDSFADYQEREAWTWEHMALTRARVISSSPAFRKKIEDVIRSVLTRPRDPASTAGDVADMRRAIALEKGEDDVWDLKLAAGGLVDIDFIAQYLQLVHAADKPEILSVSTLQVLDNAARLGVLPQAEAEMLRSATRLYHDLTQILRLCVTGKFNPETAGENLQRVMARAGDTPDFSTLEARVRETQAEVRRVFLEIVG